MDPKENEDAGWTVGVGAVRENCGMVELDGAEFEPEPNLKLREWNQRSCPVARGQLLTRRMT